jgi:hypothetical protein
VKSLSVKLGVVFIGLAIFGHAEVWGTDAPPDGFQGMKWLSTYKEFLKRGLFKSNSEVIEHERMKLREAKVPKVGELKVSDLFFCFWQDKFVGIQAFPNYDDTEAIANALKEKYGTPSKVERFKNAFGTEVAIEFTWDIDKIQITLNNNWAKKKTGLSYYYKPLLEDWSRGVEKDSKKFKKSL